MSNRLKSGVSRVDAKLLLVMLNHISRHGGVGGAELREVLGLSRATTMRMISNAREQYGVVIAYRRDGSLPSGGEYNIEDWGVFDQNKVKRFLMDQPV